MVEITTVDLSDVEIHDTNTASGEAELREYELKEIVSVEQGDGVIAAFVEESFEFPTDKTSGEDEPETEEIEASSENPVYIVALQDGGSVAVSADEIEGDGSLEGDGQDIESWDEITGKAEEAELSPVYSHMDDPNDMAELQEAKRQVLLEQVDSDEIDEESYEELVNIPGVDDPHVGFDSMPNGWTRKSVLQAWASLGGMWRTCFPRMVRVRGPNFAKRWCAALKDETLGTEEWRGKF